MHTYSFQTATGRILLQDVPAEVLVRQLLDALLRIPPHRVRVVGRTVNAGQANLAAQFDQVYRLARRSHTVFHLGADRHPLENPAECVGQKSVALMPAVIAYPFAQKARRYPNSNRPGKRRRLPGGLLSNDRSPGLVLPSLQSLSPAQSTQFFFRIVTHPNIGPINSTTGYGDSGFFTDRLTTIGRFVGRGSKLPQHKAQASLHLKFGHFPLPAARAVKRAEGPAVNSPAREGGGLARPQVRGPKDRHCNCAAPSALVLKPNLCPGLTAGSTHCRPFGPGEASFATRKQACVLQRHT